MVPKPPSLLQHKGDKSMTTPMALGNRARVSEVLVQLGIFHSLGSEPRDAADILQNSICPWVSPKLCWSWTDRPDTRPSGARRRDPWRRAPVRVLVRVLVVYCNPYPGIYFNVYSTSTSTAVILSVRSCTSTNITRAVDTAVDAIRPTSIQCHLLVPSGGVVPSCFFLMSFRSVTVRALTVPRRVIPPCSPQ